MARPAFVYAADVHAIRGASRIDLSVDLGWRIHHRVTTHLAGILCRELEQDGGEEARGYLASLIPPGCRVTFRSMAIDVNTGRTSGIVLDGDGSNVAELMVRAGFASPWDGRGVRRVPVWPAVPARVVMRRA